MVSSRLFLAALLCAALAAPAVTSAQIAVPRRDNGRGVGQVRQAYERGYEEGRLQGEIDARRGRPLAVDNRNVSRDEFRRGFVEGYRFGYNTVRRSSVRPFGGNERNGSANRRMPGAYQEPAFARGYADGYQEGLNDMRGRDRYDPVGSRDYRNGDQGYYGSYGSRDTYKNNYRAGFRQGYEEGYRSGR
jgi:hypothetical protein